jgi:nicotinate phosphoribosyltransferase
VASNDLDEYLIRSLKLQGAAIGIWGVGTRLSTAHDQPALGCVYKLSAIRGPDQDWHYRVKLSEQKVKVSNPGLLQVRRYRDGKTFIGDMLLDIERPPRGQARMVDPMDATRTRTFDEDTPYEHLLRPVVAKGQVVLTRYSLEQIRIWAKRQLEGFHQGIQRLDNPHQYPVGLEESLHSLKNELIQKGRGSGG